MYLRFVLNQSTTVQALSLSLSRDNYIDFTIRRRAKRKNKHSHCHSYCNSDRSLTPSAFYAPISNPSLGQNKKKTTAFGCQDQVLRLPENEISHANRITRETTHKKKRSVSICYAKQSHIHKLGLLFKIGRKDFTMRASMNKT